MQEVDISGLHAIAERLERTQQLLVSQRGPLLESIGKGLGDLVQGNIRGAGFRDGGAKLAGWQRYRVGSRLGYVAVSAIGTSNGGSTGPNSEGAITNYNESGHATRPRTGRSTKSKYRPNNKVLVVAGRKFYRKSAATAPHAAEMAVARLVQELAQSLGG